MSVQFNLLLVIFVSSVSSTFICKLIKKICDKFLFYDLPDNRKSHNKPTPNLGGVGIFFSFCLTLLLFVLLNRIQLFEINLLNIDRSYYVIFFSSILFFIIGLIDDLLKISPFIRLLLQFLITFWVCSLGINIKNIDISILGLDNSNFIVNEHLSVILTSFWIVGIVNAINWIDGIDLVAIGSINLYLLGFLIISIFNKSYEASLFVLALISSSVGFIKYNKYPARLFMGDSGSYFLGFLISTLGIVIPTNNFSHQDLLSSFIILFLPIFDMFFVILKRLSIGKNIFFPDRSHIHHRLLDRGININKTIFIILSLNLIATIFGILI